MENTLFFTAAILPCFYSFKYEHIIATGHFCIDHLAFDVGEAFDPIIEN